MISIRRQASGSEQTLNDLIARQNDLLRGLHDTLGQHQMLLRDLIEREHDHRRRLQRVKVSRSSLSATSLTLPAVVGAICEIATVIFTVPAAATLNIGGDSFNIPAAGINNLPLSRDGCLIVYPEDVVSLVLNGANPVPGPMGLLIAGIQKDPSDVFDLVR